MKKRILRALCFVLALCAVGCFCLTGCSSKGKTLLKYDGETLSQNMYMLFLSRLKGTLASSDYYGTEALKDSFWDAVTDADGRTRNDIYKAQILDNAKTYLAALHLFEELGLKLPDSKIDEIDERLEGLIEDDADGSKSTFNSILSAYGANYRVLRDAYILEAKISYLRDYLFGSDGSRIAENVYEEYYEQNYARFKQVFIYTYAPVYVTDADGNDVYYTSDNKIAYDKNANQKKNEDGVTQRDENGDIIYVDDEGKVAYDKENGTRAFVYDENGYVLTREFTREELINASDRAQLVLEEAREGESKIFDSLVKEYSEDEGSTKYANGYYVTKDSQYDSPEVIEALFEMEPGEVRRVDSDYGIHIVMRYELEAGGYALDDNSDFFISTTTGKYVFLDNLISQLLSDYLDKYVGDIVVDEKLLEGINIKNIGANYYY
ncbi:MAG: peptidyl-prolyl cis-trans isomerase [Eubacteriales bacterium]